MSNHPSHPQLCRTSIELSTIIGLNESAFDSEMIFTYVSYANELFFNWIMNNLSAISLFWGAGPAEPERRVRDWSGVLTWAGRYVDWEIPLRLASCAGQEGGFGSTGEGYGMWNWECGKEEDGKMGRN
jgi:hypothetical protein